MIAINQGVDGSVPVTPPPIPPPCWSVLDKMLNNTLLSNYNIIHDTD